MPHSTLNRSFYILHSTFYIIIALAMISCNSTTKPPAASLTGRVVLVNDTDNPALDPADFSGVSVALYHLAILDTTIVRINSEYPQIGVQISQEMEFDHRLQNPVKVVTTDSDGNFRFESVPYGTYNIVFSKDEWGFRCVFDQILNDTANLLRLYGKQSDLVLYPERQVPAVIDGSFTFLADRQYIADDDVLISPSAVVYVESNSTLLLSPDKRLIIYGDIITTELAENAYFSVIPKNTDGNKYGNMRFQSVQVFNPNEDVLQEISGFSIKGSIEGMQVIGSYTSVSGCMIESTQGSFAHEGGDNCNFSRMLLRSSFDCLVPVLSIANSNITTVNGIILLDNENGVLVQNSQSVLVERSMFVRIGVGVLNQLDADSTIQYNIFENNGIAIRNANRATCVITNNTISAINAIRNEKTLQTHTANGWTEFVATNNNFHCTSHSIVNRMSFEGFITYHLNAKNNYWGTSNQSEISNLILDWNDNNGFNGIVDYIPVRTNRIVDAGVSG